MRKKGRKKNEAPAKGAAPPPPPQRSGRLWARRPVAIDLALIVVLTAWFYGPFLGPGLPPCDFPSYVMGMHVGDKLVASPFDVASWNPWRMCGRPDVDFWTPFDLLELPLRALDPIARLKALVLLFNLLSGLAMYGLMVSLSRSRDAALFAGLIFPIMPVVVGRTAGHGHIHVPMFFALLSLIVWAFFRLRTGHPRRVVVLGLVLGLALVRDVQRTLLFSTMLGVALTVWAAAALAAWILCRRRRPLNRAPLTLLGLFLVAFTLAVAFDSVETVGSVMEAPYRGGFLGGQSRWMEMWSLDNVYTFFDRDAVLGAALEPVSDAFYASRSRYVGLALCALALTGALWPRLLGRSRRAYWLLGLLFPLSAWLACGNEPLGRAFYNRWYGLLNTEELGLGYRLGVVAGLGLCVALAAAVVARNLPVRRARVVLSVAIVILLGALYLSWVPLPLVRRVVFFLGDLRNPDWFQVSAASFGVLVAASLALAGLARRLRRRVWWPLLWLGILSLVWLDFWPYRSQLASQQGLATTVELIRPAYERIGEDTRDFRVLPAEETNCWTDLGAIWHDKPLAWDFRAHTAPKRTWAYMVVLRSLLTHGRAYVELAGTLAGVANIGYIVDVLRHEVDITPASSLTLSHRAGRVVAWKVKNLRPLVQAYPEVHLMLSDSRTSAIVLTGLLAPRRIGLVHLDHVPEPEVLARFPVIYMDEAIRDRGLAPPRARLYEGPRSSRTPGRTFKHEPVIDWTRPRPELLELRTSSETDFFLLVAESYHPWWSARLDGEPLHLYPGAYAFLGAQVPAGQHSLELSFKRPFGFHALAWLSLTSTLAALSYLAVPSLRRLGSRFSRSGGPVKGRRWPTPLRGLRALKVQLHRRLRSQGAP